MRILGYIRVSTGEQAESGNGLASQEQQIVRGVLLHEDWQLLDPIHRDEGVSAKGLDRPELQKALKLIASRQADGLIVAKLDRLTRNLGDFVDLIAWFEQAGAALVALDLNVDTSTPSGRMMAQIFAVFAEWERSMASQRTRDALAAVRASGRVVGHPGVRDRPEVLQRVTELRADGATYRQICDMLNEQGVPTIRGGKLWRPSALTSLLRERPERPKPKRVAILPAIRR